MRCVQCSHLSRKKEVGVGEEVSKAATQHLRHWWDARVGSSWAKDARLCLPLRVVLGLFLLLRWGIASGWG